MDRFIGFGGDNLTAKEITLKSNMDRFIEALPCFHRAVRQL